MNNLELFGSIIGLIGTACICLSYFQNINGTWTHNSKGYLITNLIGAIALLISLLISFNLGSFVIEIFWITVSVFGLYKLKFPHHFIKKSK